jgi:hypothetical protein
MGCHPFLNPAGKLACEFVGHRFPAFGERSGILSRAAQPEELFFLQALHVDAAEIKRREADRDARLGAVDKYR